MQASGALDPDAVRAAVEAVYRRPDLAAVGRRTLWDAVWEWVAEHVAGLGATGRAVTVALALAAAAALAYVVAGLVVAGVRRGRASRSVSSGAGAAGAAASSSPEAWRARALEMAARGDFVEAVRALYRYVLAAWDARGWIRFHESKTGGEYVRECGGGERAVALARFVQAVNAALFGGRACDAARFAQLRGAAEALAGVPHRS